MKYILIILLVLASIQVGIHHGRQLEKQECEMKNE